MSIKAINFLKKDKNLKKIIEKTGIIPVKLRKDYFNVLVISITNQQLSGASSGSIYKRLKKSCNNKITPQKINDLSILKLRKFGFSKQKINYLKILSAKFLNKEINPRKFHFLSDEKIIEELTSIKGIGRWTAEMFLMFSLGREDVFPSGDLGIKKGIQKIYNLKNLSPKKLDEFSKKWSPYRTYASLYLWKNLDTDPQNDW